MDGPERTVYLTPLVHSLSLTQLQYSDASAICVDRRGIIEWVEHFDDEDEDDADEDDGDKTTVDPGDSWDRDCGLLELEEVLQLHGLMVEDVHIVRMDEGFVCPGFVDTHTVSRCIPLLPSATVPIAVSIHTRLQRA